MPRKRNTPDGLPSRVYKKGPSYYYVDRANKWHRLGRTIPEMHRALGKLLEGAPEGLGAVIDRYIAEVLPKKASSTAGTQEQQIERLRRAFGRMSPNKIRPVHVAQYHDARGQTAPVAANRELALMSHVMRFAVRIGRCDTNPCETIQRHPEEARDRYVTNDEYNAIWQMAAPHMRVIMDLAFLTGQRQGDLVRLRRDQLHADGIHFTQGKSIKRGKPKRKIVIAWSENLRAVIAAAGRLTSVDIAQYVVCKSNGQPYSSSGVQSAWQKLQRKAFDDGVIAERFTFHDIRAKAGTDDADGRLLGHMDPKTLQRVYRRKAETFSPVY